MNVIKAAKIWLDYHKHCDICKDFRIEIPAIYAVEDRTPRVYPWMNEPGGGIMPPWNI